MKNLLTKEAFAEWCEKQPADRAYSYFDNCGCAFHAYLVDVGMPVDWVGGMAWVDQLNTRHPLPSGVFRALADEPWTFSALAARLRENRP